MVFTGPISVSLLRSAGSSIPSVTLFTNEGSEYADPSAGKPTSIFPSSSDDLVFAFFADLAGDGPTDLETAGVLVGIVDAAALLCL